VAGLYTGCRLLRDGLPAAIASIKERDSINMSNNVSLTYDGGWKLLLDINSTLQFMIFLQIVQVIVLIGIGLASGS
jgi:hypothetical protein